MNKTGLKGHSVSLTEKVRGGKLSATEDLLEAISASVRVERRLGEKLVNARRDTNELKNALSARQALWPPAAPRNKP